MAHAGRGGGGGGKVPQLVANAIKPRFKKIDVPTPKGSHHTPGNGSGPSGVPKSTPKPRSRPPQSVIDRWNRGNQFNKDNYGRYDKAEVTLANGKRLDSYNHGDAIVSRKHTQLAEVDEKTARSYINEIDNKYAPGTVIKDTPHNAPYGGMELQGTPTLEIPPQNGPIPPSILQHARDRGVTIVDPTGHVYT